MAKSDVCRLCLCKSEDTAWDKDEKSQLVIQIKEIFGFEVSLSPFLRDFSGKMLIIIDR